MKVIGITGGVGTGKSKVLEYINANYNAYTCQLDEVARNLQKKGTICYQQIIETFGTEILSEDEELNREKLAEIIFVDPAKRELLNDVVHPHVRHRVANDLDIKKYLGYSLFVIEAALLIETEYSMFCDEMWYIYASEATRVARLRESRGYSQEKIKEIMASQLSDNEFREGTDYVIDNSGSFSDTAMQIDKRISSIAPVTSL